MITGTHGVRGRVKLRSYTRVPEEIAAYTPLCDETGARRFSLRITGHAKEQLIAEIEGVTRCEDAEALRGVTLYVEHARLKPAEGADEFLVADLIGLAVRLEDGASYGTVKAVHEFGAGTLLELQPHHGESEIVRFTREHFPNVERDALTFRPPESA
jgi:16S rRNA processing protein RimM